VNRLSKASLGPLTLLGAGGQGVVFGAPAFRAPYTSSCVYKEYKPETLASVEVAVLETMPQYLESLSFLEGQGLVARTAWPCQLVENPPGVVSGFVMPTIPPHFFMSMTKKSGKVDSVRAEFQHLLNDDDVLAGHDIGLTDRLRYQLLAAAAEALNALHRNNICVGDFSARNLLFAFNPPAVYFIDSDSMLLQGRTVSRPVETLGWNIPKDFPDKISDSTLPTRATDSYKFGLLVLRLMAGEQDIRSPGSLPGHVPAPIRNLLRSALAANPATRPAPQVWIAPLVAAAATASDAPPQKTPTPQPAQPTWTQGSSPPPYTPGPPTRYNPGPPVTARRSRKWPYVVAAGVAAIWLTAHFGNNGNHNTTSTPPSIMSPAYRGTGNASGPDSDQIRQLVQSWTAAFNNRDLATMQSLTCGGLQLNGTIFLPVDIRGKMSSEVTNINVTGDQATANIINSWSGEDLHNAETDRYGKENGVWKICHTVNY
jgi:serine/threonine protein kinase